MIYLLHYDRPLHHAQHYLGSCDDPQRIQDHGNGTSRARLPQVFFQLGTQFIVARTWEGGRTGERKLKNQKNARVLCPICRTHKLNVRANHQRNRRSQRKLPFPDKPRAPQQGTAFYAHRSLKPSSILIDSNIGYFMKLFAIRLENADMMIVTANTPEEALKNAGLTAPTLFNAAQQLKQMGVERDHADLVLDGIGPQRYEIRELDQLTLTLRISHMGDFSLTDMDEQTYFALSEAYPIMNGTVDEIIKRWPDPIDVENHRAEYDSLLADAYSREKTRLMMPPEAD